MTDAPLYGDVDIPPEDVDYAVENALWVAHAALTTRTSVALDYLKVFESQLVTHWRELEKLHWEPSDPTEQTTLVTDGGIDHCPGCESSRFYSLDAPGSYWCEDCELEYVDFAGEWLRCGYDGDLEAVEPEVSR